MNNDVLLSRMQKAVRSLEEVFFDAKDGRLDLARLDAESEHYDPGYEKDVRRPDMGLPVILDEILYMRHLGGLECAYYIYQLEKILFSPYFYRGLIFGTPLEELARPFRDFLTHFVTNIELFENAVTEEAYQEAVKGFDHAKPPAGKNEFLAQLKAAQESLSLRLAFFADKPFTD